MYQAFMVLLAVAMLFTFVNQKFLKLQLTIGLMILGMIMSGILLLFKVFDPPLFHQFPHIVKEIDFRSFVMNGILSFLLFAGAIHINVEALNKERLTVFMFSILGTVISTLVVGYLSYYGFQLLGITIPLLQCMLFGALISPTDPIAVLAIFKDYQVRQDISIKIEGESLFNDGIGIVLFITVSQLLQGDSSDFSMWEVSMLFLREAVGGIAFGIVLGFGANYMLKLMKNDPESAILTTLVVATGGYAVASLLDISGALAMVAAGLMVGSWVNKHALKETQNLVGTFWKILDSIFNSVLFVLMGLVILLIDPSVLNFAAAGLVVIIVLVARFISVSIPYVLVDKRVGHFPWFNAKVVSVMTWSGLRGALAFALALSVSTDYHGHFFIFITYCVVAFSIIVQGLTIGKLVKKMKL
jgi:CPA1 family monovalent cation:H+ antiporter